MDREASRDARSARPGRVCVCVRERVSEGVCVCERERESESEGVCVCERERVRVGERERVCACERERDGRTVEHDSSITSQLASRN